MVLTHQAGTEWTCAGNGLKVTGTGELPDLCPSLSLTPVEGKVRIPTDGFGHVSCLHVVIMTHRYQISKVYKQFYVYTCLYLLELRFFFFLKVEQPQVVEPNFTILEITAVIILRDWQVTCCRNWSHCFLL